MTKNLLFALLVAFSTLAQGADTTEDRIKRLEDTMELSLRVNYRIAIELERLKTQDEKIKLLLEAMIGDIIDLKKGNGK